MKTATLVIPSFLHEEMTRHAISPRFAINTLVILGMPEPSVGSGGIFNKWPVFCDIFPCKCFCFVMREKWPPFIGRVTRTVPRIFTPRNFKCQNLSAFSRILPTTITKQRTIKLCFQTLLKAKTRWKKTVPIAKTCLRGGSNP